MDMAKINKIKGGKRDDVLAGSGEADKIEGKAGDDLLEGLGGHDLLLGDKGNDTLSGGDGADRLDGDKGNDQLNGGTGRDLLAGGAGDDQLSGGDDDDVLFGDGKLKGSGGGSGKAWHDQKNANKSAWDKWMGSGSGEGSGTGSGKDTGSGSNNDYLDGGAGDDLLVGETGNDTLLGSEGNDVLFGDDYPSQGSGSGKGSKGSGSGKGSGEKKPKAIDDEDYLDGGAGADQIIAGAGEDVVHHNVGENTGATDVYDGGEGIDALRLEMTLTEWLDPIFQTDLAAYLLYLANPGAEPFQFTAFDLGVENFESIEATVDGDPQGPADEAITAVNDSFTTDENTAIAGNVRLANGDLADDIPDYLAALSHVAAVNGSLTVQEYDFDNSGAYDPGAGDFTYDPTAHYQYLAVNEYEVEEFTYTIEDADGDTSTATVAIRVNGVNDTPILASTLSKETDEDAAASVVELLEGASDVDTSDSLNAIALSQVAGRAASFVFDENADELTLATIGLFDDLAVGEWENVVFNFTVSDSNGGDVPQTLIIKVSGENDIPELDGPLEDSTDEDASPLELDLLVGASDVDETDQLNAIDLVQVVGRNTGTSWNQAGNSLTINSAGLFDDLPKDAEETLRFNYTVSDGNGGEVAQSQTITVQGRNDAPTVGDALSASASEEDDPFEIDLLQGAGDVDNNAVLGVTSLVEIDGKGGWSLDGNVITIDPDYFDSLNDGDVETLELNYQVDDGNGGLVTQSLALTINGFTDAPSLALSTAPAANAHQMILTISSQPARDERVQLSFAGLPAGAIITNARGQVVTSGVYDFIGTEDFTIAVSAEFDTSSDIEVTVTGIQPDGRVIGVTSENIELDIDYGYAETALSFVAKDQNMWGPGGGASIGWHEYFPFVGTVSEDAAGNLLKTPWSSGAFNVVDINISADEIGEDIVDVVDDALVWAQSQLTIASTNLTNAQNAKTRADDRLEKVNASVAAWVEYDLKNGLYLAAKALYDAAHAAWYAADQGADALSGDLSSAQAHLATLEARRITEESDARVYISYWVPTPTWTDPFAGYWQPTSEYFYDPVKWAKLVATEGEILAQKAYIVGLEAGEDGLDLVASKLLDARDLLLEPMTVAEGLKDDALTDANAAQTAMHSAGYYVGHKVGPIEAGAAVAEAASALTEVGVQLGLKETAQLAVNVAQSALDGLNAIIATVDIEAALKLDAEVYASVGLQVDFDLDLGSVDTDVDYQLDTTVRHNHSTDQLQITPALTNMTTGDSVAFTTMSPNAQFKAAILVDAGAYIDIYIDAYGAVGDDVLFDLSPNSDGINIAEHISIIDELVLADIDSRDGLSVSVPGIADFTDDIMEIELALPYIETEGTAAAYEAKYFDEGDLLEFDFSEISSAFFNFFDAGIDFGPELKAALSVPDIGDNVDFSAVMGATADILSGILDLITGAADTDGDGAVPIFLLDATDETATSLIHLNTIPDELLLQKGLDDDTGKFGFYVAYGESEPIIEVTLDVDQIIAMIANLALGNTSGEVFNPLVEEYTLDRLLNIAQVDGPPRDAIKKYLNFGAELEYADLDVSGAVRFVQEFTLSVDEVLFNITLEDGSQELFSAGASQSILIDNASSHDADGNGIVDFVMELVPEAWFSNDTEMGIDVGYTLDIIKANFVANLQLPLAEIFGAITGTENLPVIPIPVLETTLGPLLRVQGDLDLFKADFWEDRFEFEMGNYLLGSVMGPVEDDLVGSVGNDLLAGLEGDDNLTGGAGQDIFVFAANGGRDTITDFNADDDLIDLFELGILETDSLLLSQSGTDVVLELGGGNDVTLEDTVLASLSDDNFIFFAA